MNLLTMENVSKSYTERMLFDHISLGINEGDKIGVIGINGTGKSTLLKIIAGLEETDEGTVTKGNKLRIACRRKKQNHIGPSRDLLYHYNIRRRRCQ